MKKMKKLISLAVAFCVAASMLCSVYADDSAIQWNTAEAANGNTAYKWAVDGTTLYLHYDKPGTPTNNWVVVEEYDGADESKVDHYTKRPWQSSASTITDVVITGDASKIGRKTFCEMKALKSVTLSESIGTIDKYAFMGCTSLGPVFVVPAHVTTLGGDALMNTNIVSLIFEETEESVSIGTLRYMGRLRNITLMRPVTLGQTAIYDFCGAYNNGNYGMTNPAKVNVLVTDESYFTPLANLTAYDRAYTKTAGNEMSLAIGVFDECTVIDKKQTVTFVNDVADTLSHLLYTENNGELTVELLAHVTIDNSKIANTTANHTALKTALSGRANDIKKIVFSTGFTSTGNNFSVNSAADKTQQYPNVKEVVFPITLNHVGSNAFYRMTNLSKVNFEDTVIGTVADYAFQYAPIEKLIFPSTLSSVIHYAFADNTALDILYLPVTATSTIRQYAFGATAASSEYAGKNLKVILDGKCTISPTQSANGVFCDVAFASKGFDPAVNPYRTTTLIYDSSEWTTAPALTQVTSVADKYYDVSDNDGDGKANLFMYSFGTVAQPYKLFAGVYAGTSLSNAIELTDGTYTGGTIVNAEYDVAVDTGKTAKVFLWDGFTNIKPLDNSALTLD